MLDVIALTPNDWRQWREPRLAALSEAPAVFGSTLAEWTREGDTEDRWRARLSSVPFNAIITCDGIPAGMVGDGVVELLAMWVSPTFRSKEVGDAAVGRQLAPSSIGPARTFRAARCCCPSRPPTIGPSLCMPGTDSWQPARRRRARTKC